MHDPNHRRHDIEIPSRTLLFTNLTIHGPVGLEDDIPESFDVNLVPQSLSRLIDAWQALEAGIAVSGVKLRGYDVNSSMAEHHVKDPRLLLHRLDHNHVLCELQCFCVISTCCFIGELVLDKKWFEASGQTFPYLVSSKTETPEQKGRE